MVLQQTLAYAASCEGQEAPLELVTAHAERDVVQPASADLVRRQLSL